MSEIKIPALADTFNNEYHLIDMPIEESTDTMQMRANQKVQQNVQKQREKDRKEFSDISSNEKKKRGFILI